MTQIPVASGELVALDYLNEVARAHWRSSAVTVSNTVTETDLFGDTITIDANAMGSTRALQIHASGDILNNTGATQAAPRLKLKLGSTVMIDTGAPAAVWQANANVGAWRLYARIKNQSATNSQACTFDLLWYAPGQFVNNTTSFTTGQGTTWLQSPTAGTGYLMPAFGVNPTALTVDTTAAQTLKLTVILPTASANCVMKLYDGVIKVE